MAKDDWNEIRGKIIGLGEQSIKKSYYPELQERMSELERFRALLNETYDVIFLSNVPSGTFADVNNSACKELGYSYEEMLKMAVDDVIASEKIDETRKLLSDLFDGKINQNRATIETVLEKKDRTHIDVEISLSLVYFSDSFYLVMVARDITQRKKMENELKSSLEEKKVLITEIHHRVKNNMQIISSLLNLQTMFVDDEEAVNLLKESQNRVKSMAMIHEKLYQSKNFSEINFRDYVRSLVSDLFYSYGVDENRIKNNIIIDEVLLGLETAIPLGLIISELVSNTLKYAFPEGREGILTIELYSTNSDYELVIKDDGVGLPHDVNFEETETLGLQLVNSLVDQLDGQIQLQNNNGAEFRIVFKELEYKERI